MTVAKASPELMPKTATATAIASSKLLLAAPEEHYHEVDDQWHGNAHDIHRDPYE
jgi:hypothetical protein